MIFTFGRFLAANSNWPFSAALVLATIKILPSTFRAFNDSATIFVLASVISEKSLTKTVLSQYTFEVAKDATKIEIAQALELAFPGRKVTKVRTVYMPSHAKRVGYSVGRTQSSKKAIVTIEGDPIEELAGV